MKAFFFLSVFSTLAQAADKPVCDVSKLTLDCRIFDSAPAEIKLSDGTAFPNPRRPKTEPQTIETNSGPFSNDGVNNGQIATGGLTGGGGMGMPPDSAEIAENNKNATDLI